MADEENIDFLLGSINKINRVGSWMWNRKHHHFPEEERGLKAGRLKQGMVVSHARVVHLGAQHCQAGIVLALPRLGTVPWDWVWCVENQ